MNVLTKVKEMAPEVTQFAWDGCHKIYILENQEEVTEAEKVGYEILNIEPSLESTWEESCELRFINFWNLDKPSIIAQCEY